MPCRGGYHPPVRLCNHRLRGARRLGAPSAGATCGRPLIEDAPLAERACPAGAPLSFPKKAVGKKGPGGSAHPGPPKKRGLMAAVGCTGRAKTGRALPPALLAVTSRALPRPGLHASGLPRRPWEQLRCTHLARRAAVGALPPKYRGGCCGWETARQGCRALHRRPKLRIVRFRASPKAHSLRWASSPHGDHSVGSPRGPQFLRPSRAGGALQRKPPGRAGPPPGRRALISSG